MSEKDRVWRRAEIESPCVQICTIHPDTGLCIGCHRTAAEIGGWSRMASDERRRIMAVLPERQAAPGRRGGRSGRRGRG